MHIHPSSPNFDTSLHSEESAAIKIQAGFRGYRVRKQLNQQIRSSIKGLGHHHHHRNHYHHRSTLHCRQQSQFQHMESDSGTSSPADHTGVHTVGTNLRVGRSSDTEELSVEDRCATKIQAGVRGFLVRKKQKIASDAATKIQAGFRGFKARKETQKLKQI